MILKVVSKVTFVNRRFKISAVGLFALLGAVLVFSCLNLQGCSFFGNSDGIPVYSYNIVNTYPHDPDAFTQGLVFEDGVLYEGTGLYGQSTLRRVELETGDVLQNLELSDEFFGEGITIYGNEIIQLTWKSNVGFVYDKNSFELLQQFNYSTEGWGITHNGTCLIMSDGTSTLHFLDPQTFEEIGQLAVFANDDPVTKLNELEYVQGEIYANVWQTDRIARIEPGTGRVVGWIDLRGLLTAEDRTEPVDVLNGIAYDAEADRLFVTGKLWPKLFEIELIPPG
jgi:glutamine cyclotransferase